MSVTKTVLVREFGGYETIEVKAYPLKELEENDVQVEVHFCGLNFADLYTRLGLIPRKEKPFILGIECSGIISAVGKNVNNFKTGDRVVCYDYQGGLYRETIILSEKKCFFVPLNISLRDAAACFVNFLTAHFCLFELGHLQPNQHVFIHSCAGGVGLAAVQLANHQVPGVIISGTASTEKAEIAKSHGVTHVLKYKSYATELKQQYPEGVNLLLDNQSACHFTKNLQLLRSFGTLVLTGANYFIKDNNLTEEVSKPQPELPVTTLIMDSISVSGLHLGLVAERHPEYIQTTLNKIWNLLAQNHVNIYVDSVWILDDVVEATKVLQERRNIGKILLKTQQVTDN